ncbi:MAG: ATP-binding protein [Bacteroidota bacterium]
MSEERSKSSEEELIQELRQQIEDLKQSNQDLEHFAYVASHDLQSPLRTVEGYLGIIRKELKKEGIPPEVEGYFEHVTLGVKRLQQLIKDLLEYSRAGRMVERATIQTLPMLEIVKYNLRASIQQREVEITTENLPERFSGHRMGITQLFQNLLSNAIQFGPEDALNQIRISCTADSKYWRFSVTDQGLGIAKKDHQRIFELFTRLRPREKEDQGTGIGLALCKRIVDSHGGRIWVESELGAGSIFYFTIRKPKG